MIDRRKIWNSVQRILRMNSMDGEKLSDILKEHPVIAELLEKGKEEEREKEILGRNVEIINIDR